MATNYPVNPRVRAYGKARIDMARRANEAADWKHIWKAPMHPYPFRLGEAWKQCTEYKVDDFAAEIGFLIDVLGLEVTALEPTYAQFSSPQADFYIAVIETPKGHPSTPPDALRIQFMVKDIAATARELESRGILFELPPQPCQPGSQLHIGSFRTPHGISIELWGMSQPTQPSPYAENEQDLLALMSEEKEAPIPAYQPGRAQTPPLEQAEDEDEEEFFPGIDEAAEDVAEDAATEEEDDIEYVDDIDAA